MNNVTLSFPNGKKQEVAKGSKIGDWIHLFDNTEEFIIAARINNEICSLMQEITVDADVEPIFMGTQEASSIYRRTLCFVLATASHELFKDTRLVVGHSLGYGYYYTIDGKDAVNEKELALLKSKMQEIISEDLPIIQTILSYKDVASLLDSLHLSETKKQLSYVCKKSYTVNVLKDFTDLYFGPLCKSTGCLKHFDLMKYEQGFLLQFPTTKDSSKVPEFKDIPKLFDVYKTYKNWGKTLGVTSVGSLNEMIMNKSIKDFVNITETLQTKRIADVASAICANKDIKVVLIAGPSSSGKTTTSKKLSLQLRALGLLPRVIELDTYFIGRAETPLDEKGQPDYECLGALNVAKLNQDLVDLFAGKEIHLPAYDFNDGVSFDSEKTMKLHKNEILILEGIHGLNDKLTPAIPANNKFKIYLSALTQLNLDDHNRISTSDNRLVRRIVRDYNYRGKSAIATMRMWENVHKGERLHIFPFQNNADAMLNTALDYELAVLKVYAEPLLRCITPLEKEFDEATRLLRFLDNFSPIPANLVPGQSIIREFIGGSEFKY